jgi:hypothetical protein
MDHAQDGGGVQFRQYLDISGENKFNIVTSFLNDALYFSQLGHEVKLLCRLLGKC